jgi:DNA-binding NarL/FixJ family response regulator
MNVRVFVANDHEILRGALRAVIDMQPDMEVVGEAATGPDAEIGVRKTETDVVLMDISISNGGGRDAIAAVKRIRSKPRIVVLTFQEELGYIRAGRRHRADGYVAKRALNTELLATIRAVAQGRTLVDASNEGSSSWTVGD